MTIVVFVAIPETLISIFLDRDDPDRAAIVLSATVLLIFAAVFQVVDGSQVIALGLLRGGQDTQIPMILAAVSYFGVGLPAAYVLAFPVGLGGPGVWTGLVLGLTVAAILLNHRFWSHTLPDLAADPDEATS